MQAKERICQLLPGNKDYLMNSDPTHTSPQLELRPDLMMITGMLEGEKPTHHMKLQMEILEVGYCSDTNHHLKLLEKQAQHARLIAMLRVAGYTVNYHPITLGTTGTITTAALTTLRQLGLSLPHAQKVMQMLQNNAITSDIDITRLHSQLHDQLQCGSQLQWQLHTL